jgi:hypothetical protein
LTAVRRWLTSHVLRFFAASSTSGSSGTEERNYPPVEPDELLPPLAPWPEFPFACPVVGLPVVLLLGAPLRFESGCPAVPGCWVEPLFAPELLGAELLMPALLCVPEPAAANAESDAKAPMTRLPITIPLMFLMVRGECNGCSRVFEPLSYSPRTEEYRGHFQPNRAESNIRIRRFARPSLCSFHRTRSIRFRGSEACPRFFGRRSRKRS